MGAAQAAVLIRDVVPEAFGAPLSDEDYLIRGWKGIAREAGFSERWCRKWAGKHKPESARMPVHYPGRNGDSKRATPVISREDLAKWLGGRGE